MERNKNVGRSIDEYISKFNPEIQVKLNKMRQVIKEAAPGAKEKISYQMPAFDQHGTLVYFAAFKDHISLFPTASGVEAFRDELTGYKISKGTIQFTLDKPLPYELIKRIVRFRVNENAKNACVRSSKK